jgi:L-iditol 2-dehydrogenase
MGLIHTALLNLMGCRVVVCGEYKEQALSAGADVVLPFTINKLEERIRDITGRHGADAVFCTREGGDGIKLAVRVVGRGGRVVLFQSIRGSDIASLNMNDLHYREIEVVGTISQTISDFHRAVDLVSSHIGLYSFLETRVISATQGSIAFEMALEPSVNRVFVSFN